MKTQCTVDTSDSVRTLVALRLRGELRLASREEVKEYFEKEIGITVSSLEDQVEQMRTEFSESPEDARE